MGQEWLGGTVQPSQIRKLGCCLRECESGARLRLMGWINLEVKRTTGQDEMGNGK